MCGLVLFKKVLLLLSIVGWQQADATGLSLRVRATLKNLQKFPHVVPLPAALGTASMPVSLQEFAEHLNTIAS